MQIHKNQHGNESSQKAGKGSKSVSTGRKKYAWKTKVERSSLIRRYKMKKFSDWKREEVEDVFLLTTE